MSAVTTRTKPQSNIELRAALISAVGTMQSQAVVRDLLRLLSSPAEDKVVRRALLVAAGRYGSDQFTSAITDWTGDQDAQVRITAVRAIGQSATSFGSVQAVLATRIDPKTETQPDVRDAAWQVLSKLLPTASTEQLGFWETTRLKNEPAKRMAVLREQRDRSAKAGRQEEVAQRRPTDRPGGVGRQPLRRSDQVIAGRVDVLDGEQQRVPDRRRQRRPGRCLSQKS
ncbi:MAG: HEAT repeat domain-containing protein [Tepidisphaeraceae bacterium]